MASHSQGCHCSDCGRDDISHSLAGQVNPHTRGSSSPPSLFSLPTTTAIGLLAHRELRFLSLPPDCDPIAGIPFPYSQARHNPSAIYESVLATAAHPHVPLAPLPPDGGAGYQKPFIPGCLESTRAAARRAKEAKKRTATTCAQGSIPLDLDDSLDEGLPPTRTTEISTQSSMAGATDTTNLSRQDGGHKQSSAGARRHQGVWNEVNPVSGVFFVGHTEGALQSAPTSVPMPPSDPRTPAYRRGGLTSRQSALLDGGCSVEPSFLTQYGLDRIPPLPTAPTASRRHAFRPVSALARQRMIYCDQVSSRPLMYRVPTVSYGTDVPPPLIVPHLWNIHTRKSHRPWVEYHRKRESVEETSRKRKAIEQEMISKIDTRASAYVKEETVATEASTADTSRASKHSARCQSRLAAYLQHDGCSTKQPPQKSTRQVSVSAKRYERIKGMDSDDSGAVSAPKLSSASQKPAARIEKVAGPAPVPDASLQEDAKDSKYSLSTTEDLTTEQYREQRISRPPAATQGRNPSPSPSKEAKRSQNPASLFPRQVFPHGREGSKPPPFQPGEAEFLRPRFQPPRFAGDLYTPATVRAGKSAGQGPAAGDIGSKEGWCGLCPPASAESITTGAHKVQMGGWLNLRNSSYRRVPTLSERQRPEKS